MIKEDFSRYIEYENKFGNRKIKLKAEKRDTLSPFALKTPNAINKGGFSEIYMCESQKTHEEFALKVVLTSKMTEVKIAQLLLGEIEIMLDLKSSPFTISIEDYFVYRNDLCLVLEYCNGGDLESYIRRIRRKRATFPVEELRLIAWNVACGLNDMHTRKMMHRDIKPKNILIVEDKSTESLVDVKLCDYGLGKKVAEYEELSGSTILGTFDYFAPELYALMEKRMAGEDIRGIKYDYKIDVWSYGVLLYFSLYGKTIMEAPGSKVQVMKHHKIYYSPIKGVPESYMMLMQRCLTFDPAERPSFKDLLSEPFFTLTELPTRPKLAPYVMGALLGQGAAKKSAVYECTRDGQRFALKTIGMEGVDQKRLLSEIDTMTKLRHSENVIRLFDYFTVENQAHLIMEYCEGGNLDSYVRKREEAHKPMSPEEQTSVAYCVLRGLNEIHTHNIIHRNVHPKNVLLTLNPSGGIKRAVMADFGLARVLVDEGAQTQIFTSYQSPEMTFPDMGGAYNLKTDIWSYGMLVYFLLFGKHPDEANKDLKAVLRKGEIRYDETRAALNPELVSVMRLCLKVVPTERPTALVLLTEKAFAKYSSK